ncbi:MAG: hypothetical protein QXL89_09865 [Nitrososphaeria archaeon]
MEMLEEILLKFSSLLMLYFALFSAFGTIMLLVKAQASIRVWARKVKAHG